MKIRFIFLLLTGTILLSGVELPEQMEPRLPRKIVIGETPELTLVKDGTIGFEIVAPADAAPSAKFAGKEAAGLLGKAFGAELKVLDAPSGKCPAVILGSPGYAAKLGVDVGKLDRDGFVIKTCPEGVLIIGRDDPQKGVKELQTDHATLFGVYDFLERFAGIRFYLPGDYGTVIPKMKDWSLPAIDIYERPDFYQREYGDRTGNPGTEMSESIRHLNHLRNRHQTRPYFFRCHSLRELNYGTRFGKTHPEYFALQSNGKRVIDTEFTGSFHWDESHFCLSSGIKDEVIADALSYFKGEPASVRGVISRRTRQVGWLPSYFPAGGKFFTIDTPDGTKKCTCPMCAPEVFGTKEQQRDHYLRFFRDVAQGIKDSGVDGICVISCHYAWWNGMPPEFELPDNLLLNFCMVGEWKELNSAERDQEIAELKAWSEKVGDKLLLWTYPGRYYGEFPGIPTGTPRYAASFLKRVRPYAYGCYFETKTDYLFYNYLVFYIYGKMLWNPDSDVEALLDEHHRLMFGPAAPQMKEFFDSIERNWMKVCGNFTETSLGPIPMYPSELEMWSAVYSPAERQRLTDLFDQAEKLTADAPEYLARIKTLRREMWQPVLDAAAGFSNQMKAVADWGAYMPETGEAPAIDGSLDDPAWKKAEAITLIPSKKSSPLTVRTTVRALRDGENFYFAFECGDTETPESIVRPFDSQDLWKDACVEVFLSPDKNPERCYQIMVNASGSIADLVRRSGVNDWSWNSGAVVKSAVTPGKGWTIEIRIPRNSMDPAAESGMLANFTRRYFPPSQQPGSCVWGPFYVKHNNEIDHFGTLRFQPDEKENLAGDGDFDREPDSKSSRFLGKWVWYGEGGFPAASDFLLTGRHSALLDSARFRKDACEIRQTPAFKPDTEYELTFYVRMENVEANEAYSSGFYLRIDDFGRKEKCFPPRSTAAFSGTIPWTPMSLRFRTSKTVIPGKTPRLSFILRKAVGKVWIDHVRLEEVNAAE
ncbi:MAG: DUF4838 domain-containing protein [Lentisphaeria bacterium]|nr:DUF4838 domain-containing protein [Lentisphaeria bacterium]